MENCWTVASSNDEMIVLDSAGSFIIHIMDADGKNKEMSEVILTFWKNKGILSISRIQMIQQVKYSISKCYKDHRIKTSRHS